MSIERRKMLAVLALNRLDAGGPGGMKGSIANRPRMVRTTPMLSCANNSRPRQSRNHRRTTAEESGTDPAANIDVFVAGVGTGETSPGWGRCSNRR